MRKFVSISVLLISILLMSLMPSDAYAQDLPEILAIRELKLRPGTNEIVFQNYYNKWCKNIKKNTKGVSAWIMKGDRGERAGLYDMVWGFNYNETRDYYFPVSDITNYPKWNAALDRFRFQAPEVPLVEDMNEYTDFIVIGYDQMLNPQLGEIVSISYPEVKQGMGNELENFVSHELNNACQNSVDGFYMYLLKGDRGHFKDQYAVLRVFDTYQRRREYFPDNSEQPSQAFQKAGKKITDVLEKFKTYFSTSPTVNSSDFVVLY